VWPALSPDYVPVAGGPAATGILQLYKGATEVNIRLVEGWK